MSRYSELKAQMERLAEEIEVARAEAQGEAILTCKQLIEEFGLTPFDLGFVKTQHLPPKKVKKSDKTFIAAKPKSTRPPKYVNPVTGQTWSGYGHTPRWIEGNRDDYLIKTPHPKRPTQNNKKEQS